MTTPFNKLPNAKRWQLLVNCARQALEENGYQVRKIPGLGRQNVWAIKKDGAEKRACIRTTQDRWFAFPPLGDDKWKTLDDVEEVVVVTVDDKDLPRTAEVFIFPADDVRKRFNAAYKARKEAGRKVPLNFGMWVSLDVRDIGGANDVGSGIVEDYSSISEFPLNEFSLELSGSTATSNSNVDEAQDSDEPKNVHQALLDARQLIAEITGMPLDQVHLELRIGS